MLEKRMKIYDLDGTEIAHISSDHGVIRLTVEELVSSRAHQQIQTVLYNAGDTQDPEFEARLKSACVSSGFRFENDKDIERSIAKNVDFIHESNLIEEIVEIDKRLIEKYYKNKTQLGCVGAWLLAEDRATNKQPLSGKEVVRMQRMLTNEQNSYGHSLQEKYRGAIRGQQDWVSIGGRMARPPSPEEYTQFFTRFNSGLQELDSKNIEAILRYLAKTHIEYESMHPFADGNGRTGRNIVNYGLRYFGLPVLVFTNNDKAKYYAGFIETTQDRSVMEAYFIAKYREQNPELFH